MPGPTAPLEQLGGQPQKPTRGKPLHVARLETGIFTQRDPLHDVADTLTFRFYGGFPDALWTGSNMEITNKLTIARRPGNSQWSTASYPTPPLSFYSWQRLDGTIQVIVDTAGAVYRDNQDGTKTTILTKSAGAGPAYMIGVGNWLFIGDGVDQIKFDGTKTWNWGIATPTTAPNVVITESGAAASAWAASTWFSTMGIIIDSNGDAQQLTSVNATATNGTQFGLSGNGQPAWNQTPGGSTSDGSVVWENKGPVGTWAPNSTFGGAGAFGTLTSPAVIYDAGSNAYYENSRNSPTMSGNTKPPFNGVVGSNYFDGPGGVHGATNWVCIGGPGGSSVLAATWTPSTGYSNPFVGGLGFIIEPISPPNTSQTSFAQAVTTNGTSNSSYSSPNWSTLTGTQTIDNQLIWVNLGSATWASTTAYAGWSAPNSTAFSCVQDSVGQLQVCTQTGISGSSAPWSVWKSSTAFAANNTIIDTNGNKQIVSTPGTSGSGSHPSWNVTVGGTTSDNSITWTNLGPAYGFTTTDGTTLWTCVGPAAHATWTRSQSYYLPVGGFSPPTPSSPYGGAAVNDTNGNIEFVIETGVSGVSAPSWNATTAGTTTDNNILWYNNGQASTHSLSWTKGHVYGYSFEARTPDDVYNTTAPPGLTNPLGPPTGSGSGGVSTMSPIFTITGANSGAVNTISALGSTDPQVDTIVIWRDADGGGSDNMYELTEIPAPPPIGGVAQPWSFQDFLPDIATQGALGGSPPILTDTYPGLNTLVPAPSNEENDPPPVGFLPMAYHFERIWGPVGQFVYCSGGGDVVTGNGNESFNPSDNFEFSSQCIRLVPSATGILNYTTSDVFAILGGPSFTTFYPSPAIPGVGLLNYWALDIHGGVTFLFTADKQFLSIDPSSGVNRIGAALGDQFATWDPTKVQVSVYESGVDNCVIVADGSTGWYRLNPSQFPNGRPVWSPFASIVGGVGAVHSIETTKGVHQLLMGSETATGSPAGYGILKRDLTTYEDNGTPYTCFFNMGAIHLCYDGQIAGVTFIALKEANVGTAGTVSYLPQEIAGTYTTLSTPQAYPWQLYGATGQPSSLISNAYYLNQNQEPALMTFLFIRVDYQAQNVASEVKSLTIYGSLLQDE